MASGLGREGQTRLSGEASATRDGKERPHSPPGTAAHQRLRQLPGLGLAREDGGLSELHVHDQSGQVLHHLLTEDRSLGGRVGGERGWT